MNRLWTPLACLLAILATATCQNSTGSGRMGGGPQEFSLSRRAPAPQPAAQGTSRVDVDVLNDLRARLSLTAAQIQQLRWGIAADPCGNSTCSLSNCNWNGIACRDGRVAGIDISSSVVTSTPQLLGGSLPPQISNLTMLQFFNASGHTLSGSLPPTWGQLSNLQELDVSFNALNGTLPSQWEGLSSAVVIDLSHNELQGAVPQTWAKLTNLRTLDVSSNNICQSSFLSSSVNISNDNANPCSNPRALANAPVAAPGSSAFVAGAASPAPPPFRAPSAVPTAPNSLSQTPQQPIIQMSTGINIAVSVVIGAFLFFGIVAGAIRVRRQQAAHRAWLAARTDAMRRAEREEEQAFQRYLKRLKPPILVLDPAGDEITVALREKVPKWRQTAVEPSCRQEPSPPSPALSLRAGDHIATDRATEWPPSAVARTEEGVGPRSRNPGDQPARARAAESEGPSHGISAEEDMLVEEEARGVAQEEAAAAAGRSQAAREQLEQVNQERTTRPYLASGRVRIRKLPMFIIDAYLTPSGALTFDAIEEHSGSQPRSPHHSIEDPSNDPSTPTGGITGGIRNLWANIRGREGITDVEANRAASVSAPRGQQGSPQTPRAASFSNVQSRPGSFSAAPSGPSTINPEVAARVRERIQQLRDPEEEEEEAQSRGPAPPPPVVRWAPLRRLLGLEEESIRETRLQQQAVEMARSETTIEARRTSSRPPDTSASQGDQSRT